MMNQKEFNNINNFQKSLKTIKNKFKANLKGRKYNISIIIYCLEIKYLRETIYSILMQIKINKEIIIVCDNNDMGNSQYIRKLTNEFGDIKLINNNKYKGLLYSYSIGVLNAKGEFILSLQPGYTLANKNILYNIYIFAKTHNLDILEFNLLINNHEEIKNNSLRLYKCLHFESSKDFNIIKVNKKYKDIDQEKDILFNKLIKAKIYRNIIYKYKLNQYNITIFNFYEDILIFLLNKYKLKFRHTDEYGIILNKINIEFLKLTNVSNNKKQIINDSIFYINFIFDNSKNTFLDKKYVLQEFINLLSVIYNKFILMANNSIKLLEKFINCNFINKEDKIELIFLYNSLIN